ncbi:Acyltransferase mlcH [Mycena sanguinolenta]|uniref:Acyltransferase mlcH n=1 Tax=Mycena sanguinolenta TaxID=230812 RepID=A0A8H6XTJ1_9AGAR|nr:Acyltransferase mlcH [Mycena sanguinolenta]
MPKRTRRCAEGHVGHLVLSERLLALRSQPIDLSSSWMITILVSRESRGHASRRRRVQSGAPIFNETVLPGRTYSEFCTQRQSIPHPTQTSPRRKFGMVSIPQQQQDTIRSMMSRAVENNTLPALFCGVTNHHGEIFMHQAGRKVLGDPSSDPLDESAIFWICSMTKLITSIAAMQQIEQGKIQLSTRVSDILPELANPVTVTARDADGKPTATAPAKNPITFGQLLNHSSGLAYPQSGVAYGSHSYKDSSAWLDKIKGTFSGQPLSFEPGSDCECPHICSLNSSHLPQLLTAFPRTVSVSLSNECLGNRWINICECRTSVHQQWPNAPFSSKDHIFSPLNITSPSFYLTADLKERLLPLSVRNSENKLEKWTNQVEIINRDPEKTAVHLGGVGLYSSLKDYLALLRHLLQIKAGTGVNPILSAASVATLFEPTLDVPAANSLAKMLGMPEGSVQFSTGQMLATADVPGRRKKGTGAWGGFASTSYFIDPETGIAAVFGTQLVPTSADYDVAYENLWSEVEEAIYAGLQNAT